MIQPTGIKEQNEKKNQINFLREREKKINQTEDEDKYHSIHKIFFPCDDLYMGIVSITSIYYLFSGSEKVQTSILIVSTAKDFRLNIRCKNFEPTFERISTRMSFGRET